MGSMSEHVSHSLHTRADAFRGKVQVDAERTYPRDQLRFKLLKAMVHSDTWTPSFFESFTVFQSFQLSMPGNNMQLQVAGFLRGRSLDSPGLHECFNTLQLPELTGRGGLSSAFLNASATTRSRNALL